MGVANEPQDEACWPTSNQVLVQPACKIFRHEIDMWAEVVGITITREAGRVFLLVLVVYGKTNRVTCSITSVMNWPS